MTAAKEEFSNSKNSNIQKWSHYIKGDVKRQEYLECALKWISNAQGISIDRYMKDHRFETSIDELKIYFNSVIDWVSGLFEMTDNMRGVDWGRLYETYHSKPYNTSELNQRARELLADEYVRSPKNIYEYLLDGEKNKQLLDIRIFDTHIKKAAYKRQTEKAKAEGVSNCPLCAVGNNNNKTRIYSLSEMDADHVTAWTKGGETTLDNCEMLCKTHNRSKGNK